MPNFSNQDAPFPLPASEGLLVYGANPGGSVQSKQHRSAGRSVRAMAELSRPGCVLVGGSVGDGCNCVAAITISVLEGYYGWGCIGSLNYHRSQELIFLQFPLKWTRI